jgi:hypothetical protein
MTILLLRGILEQNELFSPFFHTGAPRDSAPRSGVGRTKHRGVLKKSLYSVTKMNVVSMHATLLKIPLFFSFFSFEHCDFPSQLNLRVTPIFL